MSSADALSTLVADVADLPALLQRFLQVRRHTLQLILGLSDEDCCVQSMPDASPIKWHLAHTSWFFETFILAKFDSQYQLFHASFVVLFNSYYNGVGEQHPRAQRGLLTRPSLAQVQAYRQHVEQHIQRMIEAGLPNLTQALECAQLLELGIQHEQQHQELMLTDIKHLFFCNPLLPAVYASPPQSSWISAANGPHGWLTFEPQLCEIGFTPAFGASSENLAPLVLPRSSWQEKFFFDNELPRHRQFIEAYQLAQCLVSNREYLNFLEAGAYRQPQYWLAEGWDWLQREAITHPLYWKQRVDGVWMEFTWSGLRALEMEQPVLHLSYFEADAYARWAGARLPTEAEWEAAANTGQTTGHHAHLCQLFGVAWQWTSSCYAAYPGYLSAAGAVGEYNGKFMVNQYVLRGSSACTPEGHSRLSYRNFFATHTRWQMTGLRLARSV